MKKAHTLVLGSSRAGCHLKASCKVRNDWDLHETPLLSWQGNYTQAWSGLCARASCRQGCGKMAGAAGNCTCFTLGCIAHAHLNLRTGTATASALLQEICCWSLRL